MTSDGGHEGRLDDLRALQARFHELVAIAKAAGVQAQWLDTTSEMQIATLVELAEYRAGNHDPRRRASLELGIRIARAKSQGATIHALTERFGLSRSQIYALIARVQQQARTDLLSTACTPVEMERADA